MKITIPFLCTALDASATDMLLWFCRRWWVEVTFEEMRSHLGMEIQRQWSDLAIALVGILMNCD
ncbi:MAG: hypothetical protein WCD18_21310 [Thermosynechococcaceae cyanobacterium]